jgi:hypothetical protein
MQQVEIRLDSEQAEGNQASGTETNLANKQGC